MDAKESKRIGGYMTATTPERELLINCKVHKDLKRDGEECEICKEDYRRFAQQYGYGLPVDVCVRFDMRFNPEMLNATKQGRFLPMEMKQFLATELSAQATEILGEVENKKAVSVAIYGNMPAPHDETYKTGYNKAIDDVLALLRSKWEKG